MAKKLKSQKKAPPQKRRTTRKGKSEELNHHQLWKFPDTVYHPSQIPFYKSFRCDGPRYFDSDADAKSFLKEQHKKLADLQDLLYATHEWGVLIVLQGMDTAGKDGLIKHVFAGMNPLGCEAMSFKKPTHLEYEHDFLWRYNNHLPKRGHIGIFNRSYYEDVIVPQVHPEIISDGQLPKQVQDRFVIANRCQDIVNFEQYLGRQGYLVIKLFLHLSPEEQFQRLLSRLDEKEKHWKFDGADLSERTHWQKYQKAFDSVFRQTSHDQAPWHILPADNKQTARLLATQIIVREIAKLPLKQPETPHSLGEIQKYRRRLKSISI